MSSTASPSLRAFLMWVQMAACAPTSTPRVGWAATSSTGVLLISRPDDQLLLVAAGERAGQRVGTRGAHVVLRDDPLGVGARGTPVDQPVPHARAAGTGVPSIRFSHSGESSSRPWRWRSSGM